jgi:hypothetical protein
MQRSRLSCAAKKRISVLSGLPGHGYLQKIVPVVVALVGGTQPTVFQKIS